MVVAGDEVLEIVNGAFLVRDETTATIFPSSMTGRWRQRLFVMCCMHSEIVFCGFTVTTFEDMISCTFISREERPARITLRA